MPNETWIAPWPFSYPLFRGVWARVIFWLDLKFVISRKKWYTGPVFRRPFNVPGPPWAQTHARRL
jgi:hypothetical protein